MAGSASSQPHILQIWERREHDGWSALPAVLLQISLSSGLSARLVLHCTKHTSIILALYFLLVCLPGSYRTFSCEGAEWKLRLAVLPEIAYICLLKKNRQMGEQKSSSAQKKVMVIQYFKMSHFQSFYAPYAPCLLWTSKLFKARVTYI